MAPFGILFAIVFIIPCCVSPFGFFLGRVYRKPPCRTNCWNILDVFGLSAGGFLHSLEELDAN